MLRKISVWCQLLHLIWKEGPENIITKVENSGLDSLTKIKNRQEFEKEIKEEFERSKRSKKPFSLLFADVDDFKRINTLEGHLKGDKVLQLIANELQNHCREIDRLFRYGGDEFVILVPETGKEGAQKLKERIEKVVPNVSIGVSSSKDKVDIREMIEKADEEMFHTKENKKK